MTMLISCLISARTLAVFTLILLIFFPSRGHAEDTTTITTTSTSTVILGTSTITVQPGDTKTYVTGDITVSTAISTPTPAGGMAPSWSGSGFEDAMLNSTNYYRDGYQAKELSWNSTLASYAKNHAKKCLWEHSVCYLGMLSG